MRVTVVISDEWVIIRGRDAAGAIAAEERVRLGEMSEDRIGMMRHRLKNLGRDQAESSASAPQASHARPR